MKGIILAGMLVLLSSLGLSGIAYAAADMQKHNAWKRKHMEQTLMQVDAEGQTKGGMNYPFIRKYDSDKDGYIDENEARGMRSFLEKVDW